MNAMLALFQWGSSNVLPILFGMVALGVVVFLHELGHFIVAKLSGMRVEVFSIGFPPKIWGFKKGETEYRISWIFFGGYVKLAGMDFEDGVDPRSVKDGYFASPIRNRLAVCVCGPLMNLLSAFAIYCYLFCAGFPVPANLQSTVIGTVMENLPAEAAGLRPGDRITEINGRPVERWEDVTKSIVLSARPEVELKWDRDGVIYSKRITPEQDKSLKLKRIGILPTEFVSVDIIKGSTAEKAGMMDGDFIFTANGKKIYSWMQLSDLIRSSEGKRVKLGLMREGMTLEVSVIPSFNRELEYPAIGIKLNTVLSMDALRANGLVVYLYRNPFSWIGSNIKDIYLTLRGLVVRAISPRGLGSPIDIVYFMGYSMRSGFRQFLYVMAFISVNLAVLNLLPIPVLDGGHILFGLIEGVRRHPISMKTVTVIQNFFLVVLFAFMIFLVFNSVMRYWGGYISKFIGSEEVVTPTPKAVEKP